MAQFSGNAIKDNSNDLHIFSIYSDPKEKLESGFMFLKEGLQNNEAVLLVTDEITKEEAIKRFKEICKNELPINDFLKKGIITILSGSEWYFFEDKFDLGKMIQKWKIAVGEVLAIDNNKTNVQKIINTEINSAEKENNNTNKNIHTSSLSTGKIRRLRAFCDMKSFHERGLNDMLLNYESSGDKKFPFPLYSLCAYESSFISKLNPEIFKTLVKHHEKMYENNYNALVNPSSNMHIMLIYKDDNELDNAITTYINEGLKKGQICIYGTFSSINEKLSQYLASSILNYKENIEKGNLILIDLSSFYINAMIGNYEPFEKIEYEIMNKINVNNNEVDKNKDQYNAMRFSGICTALLFKNKHFAECIQLEKWWHQKSLKGSTLCAYPKALFNQYPFDIYVPKIFHYHHIVIDTNGKLVSKYME